MRLTKYIIAIIILAAPGWLNAQPPPGPPPGFEGGPMREKIRERIQTMKVWKLTEEVGLTSQQSEKFFPVYNRFQKSLEDIEMKRADLIDKLEKLTNQSDASDKDLENTMKALGDIPRQIMAERDKFYQDVSGILPLKQQAKLAVFEERFRQRLQQLIRDTRRDFRGGKMDDE
jgi:hypothetical protein